MGDRRFWAVLFDTMHFDSHRSVLSLFLHPLRCDHWTTILGHFYPISIDMRGVTKETFVPYQGLCPILPVLRRDGPYETTLLNASTSFQTYGS